MVERLLFYRTGIYRENLDKGEDYIDIPTSISIWITDYNVFEISSKLEEWLTFIENENLEAIKMSNNENIKKAEAELEYLTGDEETRRLAYLREKAIRDEISAMNWARRDGIEKIKKQHAKKMLAKNIDIDLIIEITGLTREEIEKL